MNPRPPVDDAAIEPTRRLSPSHLADYFTVLAWALWAPLMFVYYSQRYIDRSNVHTRFPSLEAVWHDPSVLKKWRRRNREQWALFVLSRDVGLVLLFSVPFLNAVFLMPLGGFDVLTVWGKALLLTAAFFGLLALQIAGGWYIAERYDNVGYLLSAALSGGIALAFMLLFLVWMPHFAQYLSTTSPAVLIVFAVSGYAVGFYINFFLAVMYRRVNRFAYLLLALVLIGLAWLTLLLALRGVTWETYEEAWAEGQRQTIWAGVCWWIGLLFGVLRVVEWIVYMCRPLPHVTDTPGTRAWRVPGATQLPAVYLYKELDKWLRFDWQRGMNVVERVAYIAGQEWPWAEAVRGRLASEDGVDAAERLTIMYDSGIMRIGRVTKPPKPPKQKATTDGAGSSSGSESPAKSKAPKRYQQETLLAHEIHHARVAPLANQEGESDSIRAAFWYYYEGYLFEAADIFEKLKAERRTETTPSSPALAEISELAATFLKFMDLEAASYQPTVALQARTIQCRRTEAWKVVDRLAEAARWVWRARRCRGYQRRVCRKKLRDALNSLQSDMRRSPLAERKLVLGTVAMWRKQLPRLLRPTVEAEATPITLRPWSTIYAEMSDECPWHRVGEQLRPLWRLGYTQIALVDGQPFVDVHRAISYAVQKLPLAVEVVCDARQWTVGSTSFLSVCQSLCEDVGEALGELAMVPSGTALRVQTPAQLLNAVRDAINAMCRSAPERCVVLTILGAELFESVLSAAEVDILYTLLCELELRVPNLALVIQTSDTPRVSSWLQTTREGLTYASISVRLLSSRGVELWLGQQFEKQGIWFSGHAIELIEQQTGGHPKLLMALAQCIRDEYNSVYKLPDASPFISKAIVVAAAKHPDFGQEVQDFSWELANQLGYFSNNDVRSLLIATARGNWPSHNPITIAKVRTYCDAFWPLTTDYIAAQYQAWMLREVIETVKTRRGVGFRLRCFSFAGWLAGTAANSAPRPPRSQPPSP